MNPKRVFRAFKRLATPVLRENGWKEQTTFHYEGGPRASYFRAGPFTEGNHKDPTYYEWESHRSDFGKYSIVWKPYSSTPWSEANVTEGAMEYPDAPNWTILDHDDMNVADGIAYTKMYERVISAMGTYRQSWLMTFAEMSKTTQLVADAASKIRQLQKVIKNPDAALRLLKEWGHALDTRVVVVGRRTRRHIGYYFSKAANTWLPVYYGVLPILNDLENAYDAFIRQKIHEGTSSTIRATAGSNVDWEREASTYNGVCGWGFKGKAEVTSVVPYLANYMGLINPLEAINDKLPFSFVANWFLGYERYLRSLTDWSGVKVVGYLSNYRACERLLHDGQVDDYTKYVGRHITIIGAKYKRIPVDGPLTPPNLMNYFQTYATINPFGNGRYLRSLAALALLAQRVLPWLEKQDKAFKQQYKDLDFYFRTRNGWRKGFKVQYENAHVHVRNVRSLSTNGKDVYIPRERKHRAGYELRKPVKR